jgi:atypical dual specificity phosphatase
VDDSPDNAEELASHFETAFEFISQGTKRDKGKVLVHCVWGRSRSATICIAYLMKERGLSLDAATRYVRSCRPCICPNMGFMEQLRIFEQTLQKAGQKDTGLRGEEDTDHKEVV